MKENNIKFGVQIINRISDIEILVVRVDFTKYKYLNGDVSREPYESYMKHGKITRSTMNGVGKAFHFDVESAVQYILQGRCAGLDCPHLIPNEVKAKAISQIGNVFNRLKKIEKIETFKQQVSKKADEAYNAWQSALNDVNEQVEAFKKEINF
jgi:hypothetical protein